MELQLDVGSVHQIKKLLRYEGLSGCRNEEKMHMRAPTEELLTFCPLKGAKSLIHQTDSESKRTRKNVQTRKELGKTCKFRRRV